MVFCSIDSISIEEFERFQTARSQSPHILGVSLAMAGHLFYPLNIGSSRHAVLDQDVAGQELVLQSWPPS